MFTRDHAKRGKHKVYLAEGKVAWVKCQNWNY